MEPELERNSSKADYGRGKKEEEEEEEEDGERRKLGGIKTMPFIISNEICDKFAAAGFHANMITYLTQQLNLSLVKASNTLTNFGGTSNFTSLISALIADCYAGRYWTIIGGSIIYELGMISLTISAVLPSLRPPPCSSQVNCKEASTSQLWVLYMSSILTSIGSGSIKPCVVTFAADQYDMRRSAVASRSWNFFNLYYFCMGMATLTALTVVVYIQDSVGWGWGLGIPAVGMALSIIVFIFGSSLYNKLKPEGSPLVRLAQVVVAAARKRKEVMPLDPGMLYHNRELDAAISVNGRLLHSNQFKWFDRAAIVTDEDAQDLKSPNLWRIATVHRIEELKCIVRMLPICLEVSMGNYIGTIVVSLVHKYTGRENNWLPDRNLNRGKLDYYYWLITGMQVINLVYYVVCAWFYTYKPLEEVKDEDVPAEDEIQHKQFNYAEGKGEVELRRNVIV
ncbi:hypothetical protein OIU84_011679 [Salix udensis]|uniref:Uncharacterized protein n=1 Tax=Salix udensis TaxID=889485 RepID=A0AAD6JNF8_9ROSI|nr:hypothetical protein OIU84_011679 [Salix udensis]